MIPTLQLGQMGLRRAAVSGGGGGATDPLWSSVFLLLNMGGADGSTTFTDEKGHTITRQGDAQIDTSLGYNAGLFDGSGDYLISPSNADWGPGTAEFTVEAWVRQPSGQQGGDRQLFCVSGSGGLTFGLQNGKAFCGPNLVSYGPIASTAISADTLSHVAACKHAGTMYIYHDGVLKASAADSRNYGANQLGIAGTAGGGSVLNGWIKALRGTIGARYPGGTTFTPEAAPWPTS